MSGAGDTAAPLGGFFGLELPDTGAGLWAHWGAARGLAFANATSALAALVRRAAPGAVWFPGFVCAEFTHAVPEGQRRYYAVDEDLGPEAGTLDPAPGDIVVGVNYFGRAAGAAGAAWRARVAAHPRVTFVEDCAQALDTGVAPWGQWRLYSPRKLAGIPDGGLLVPMDGAGGRQVLPPAPEAPPVEAVQAALAAKLARMEHPLDNALWHPMNQAHEAAHAVSGQGMSTLSRRLMGLIDVAAVSARRHENYRVLAEALAPWSVLADPDPAFVPFGFPVRLAPGQRDRVAQALYGQGIFPAVHWRDLPGVPSARDRARAESWLTLPCDQRWSVDDMARMARAFAGAAA
ncbi:PLP-dependent aminotransferase family protein [Marinibacterium profundimaris]|uniref:Aminotransferase n=1 Tax=Marinibacterium profundimaris TaxID=1679460 RepID=A0A225NBY3_9RHOB|nr:hypothetical protein [Marinibacterium profundimaris]MAU94942.1 hypothetical protein [Fulvimarina sp.]OWU68404.1 hypothetical protein ATO3_24280 [Marinibacterium profundimaris]